MQGKAAEEALDVLHAEVRSMRLELALRRDNQLTHAEVIAMLEVYQEFGR